MNFLQNANMDSGEELLICSLAAAVSVAGSTGHCFASWCMFSLTGESLDPWYSVLLQAGWLPDMEFKPCYPGLTAQTESSPLDGLN